MFHWKLIRKRKWKNQPITMRNLRPSKALQLRQSSLFFFWFRRFDFHLIVSLCDSDSERVVCENYPFVLHGYRAKSKDSIDFPSLSSVIGLKNSRHILNQSDFKVRPITTRNLVTLLLPRLRRFALSTLTCLWLLVIISWVFFTIVNRKHFSSEIGRASCRERV